MRCSNFYRLVLVWNPIKDSTLPDILLCKEKKTILKTLVNFNFNFNEAIEASNKNLIACKLLCNAASFLAGGRNNMIVTVLLNQLLHHSANDHKRLIAVSRQHFATQITTQSIRAGDSADIHKQIAVLAICRKIRHRFLFFPITVKLSKMQFVMSQGLKGDYTLCKSVQR